jgi:serine/threonine protein kinase
MKNEQTWLTDELPVSSSLKGGAYVISDISRSSNNSYTYVANRPDGTKVAVKEFYLRDMCRREGLEIQIRAKADGRVFNTLVKSFLRDAAFLTSLDSPHVANVQDLFEENGTAYMISEIPSGTLLADMLVDTKQKFTPKEIESFTTDLARALVEIHGFGMLHRDINPNNILITEDRSAILLPEFGTFREDRSSASRVVSSVLQSAQSYAPFELTFDDDRQGDGSDVYCVAAVMYHLITGAPPAPSLDRIAAVAAQDPDPYVPVEGTIKGYSKRYLQAIDMSLELFFDSRIHSATELMFIMSKKMDVTETRKMQSDVRDRSAPLHKKGLFARVRNLWSRR